MNPSMPEPQRELSIGEFRVGISFNPGGHPQVNSIKQKAAALIDELEGYRSMTTVAQGSYEARVQSESNRLISLAQTHIEDAAMWGVKAVTKS